MSEAPLHALPALRLGQTLEALGFVPRQRSARHIRYVHPDGRRTLLPAGCADEIGRGLLRKLLRDLRLPARALDGLR